MKRIQALVITALLGVLVSSCSDRSLPQGGQQDEAAVREKITAQRYVFRAQTVLPMGGRTRQLNTDYDLRVSKDTIVSFLPYFGRAFTAPMDPSKGGLQFTSTDFAYTLNEQQKGGWEILIKPRDVREIQQMRLTISSNGYGMLQVTSTNRQPISFNGYIR